MNWINVTEDDPLTLTVTPDGTVLLGTGEGGLRFRTLGNLDAQLEEVDRQRAALGWRREGDEPLPGLVAS